MARMLFLAAVSTVFTVAPAFHFPAAEPDTSVSVDTSGPFVRLDGALTTLSSASSKFALHRVDERRFMVVDELYARLLFDRVSGAVTPLVPNVSARKAGGVLVLLLLSRIVCDVDPSRPALRVLDTPTTWADVLAFDGERLIVGDTGTVRVLRAAQPPLVLPLPAGFVVAPGNDRVRGARVILVRQGPLHGATRSFDKRTWAKPVPWTLEVAVLDVTTGTATPLGKVPGRWMPVAMGCCSGWERNSFISWIDAATAHDWLRAAPSRQTGYDLMSGRPSAVVDEWNEVVTWGGAGLLE